MTKKLGNVLYYFVALGLVVATFVVQPTFAADLTSLKDQLNDARPTTAANHVFTVDQAGGDTFNIADTLIIDFVDADGWDTSALAASDPLDYDFKVGATDESIVAAGGCASNDAIEITTVNTTNDTITFTACGSYTPGAAGDIIEIEIGLNATLGGAGNSQIVNATSVGVKQVNVDTTDSPAKDTAVVLVAGVTVSATIDESITIVVNGRTAGQCTDNGGTPTIADTTSTSVPLGNSGATPGNVAPNTFYAGCQRIDIDTNASVGYNAYVSQTQLLTSGGNTIAEGNCDGAGPACDDTTPGPWESPVEANSGFGYCADDQANNGAADAGIAAADQCDDATPFYTTFFLVSQLNTFDFMASSTAVSGDQTNLAYHLAVSAVQPAGTYTNILTHVAVGNF